MPARSRRKTAEHLENPGAPTFYNFCIKALTVNYYSWNGDLVVSLDHTHSGPWVNLFNVQVLDPKLREARGR